ncbi:MAG: InlB B-repeat-containing protein [Clostridiales bacterium]|nr:InlB B-repeat-containing protein [Clostridiales bacterium]
MKREIHKVLATLLTIILLIAALPTNFVSAVSNTVYGGVDYAHVYNYEFYKGHPDLKKAFGDNESKYLAHFVNYGMKEGRQASPEFDVQYYKSNNSDLQQHYGNNLVKYYMHYIEFGVKEGRKGAASGSAGGSGTVTPVPSTNIAYQCYVKVNNIAGKEVKNQASSAQIKLARNTTSFTFSGWAQIETGISNITYDITNKTSKKTIVTNNQATVSGAKNDKKRNYQAAIQVKDLLNGENIITVYAKDKNGKKVAIGSITVIVYATEWADPIKSTDGTRTFTLKNNLTDKSYKITSSADYAKYRYGKTTVDSALLNEYNSIINNLFGSVTVPITTKPTVKKTTVTVKFDLNGVYPGTYNSWHMTTQTVGEKYVLPDQNPPDEDGYKFVGWFTAKTGGQRVYSSTVVSNTKEHTLYAHWEEKETSPEWKDEFKTKYGMDKSMFTNRGFYQCEFNDKMCGYCVYTYMDCNRKKTDFIVWGITTNYDVMPANNGINLLTQVAVLEASGERFEIRANDNKPIVSTELNKYSPDLIKSTVFSSSCLQGKDITDLNKAVIIEIGKAIITGDASGIPGGLKAALEDLKTERLGSVELKGYNMNWKQSSNLCRRASISIKKDQFLRDKEDKLVCTSQIRWPEGTIPSNIPIQNSSSERNLNIHYSFVVYGHMEYENKLTVNRSYTLFYQLKNGVMAASTWSWQ